MLDGVQSYPRVMRGVPAPRGGLNVDVSLSRRDLAGLESQGLARTLGGLESQGLARTLGSLGGGTLGEIEMPEECARAGEVLIAPGVCGPDPRKPIDPYGAPPQVVRVPIATTKVGTSVASAMPQKKIDKNLLILGAICVGAIWYFGRK